MAMFPSVSCQREEEPEIVRAFLTYTNSYPELVM